MQKPAVGRGHPDRREAPFERFFDTWKFKILVAVAVFLVGIMAYAGANGRLTAAPQELLGVILTPFQKAGAVVSGGVGAMWENMPASTRSWNRTSS